MTVFILRQEDREAIVAAVNKARANPMPLEMMMRMAVADKPHITIADRQIASEEDFSKYHNRVMLPFDFRLEISGEMQPAGLCLHFSMSSPVAGRVPRIEAMMMVLEAAGIDIKKHGGRAWTEEFLIDGKPGGVAGNVLIVDKPNES